MLPARTLVLLALLSAGACAGPPAPAAPEHHHELHLPPVGLTVRVAFEGKSVEVPLGSLPHTGGSASVVDLWKAAWPDVDLTPLRFDFTGSDGFHPASRPPCTRPLTAVEIRAAQIDVVSHDLRYDAPIDLPGCYRVHAVVAMDGLR